MHEVGSRGRPLDQIMTPRRMARTAAMALRTRGAAPPADAPAPAAANGRATTLAAS
jgi:hypothetical protein